MLLDQELTFVGFGPQTSYIKYDLCFKQVHSLQYHSTLAALGCKAEAAVFYNAVCILCSLLNPFLRTDFNL